MMWALPVTVVMTQPEHICSKSSSLQQSTSIIPHLEKLPAFRVLSLILQKSFRLIVLAAFMSSCYYFAEYSSQLLIQTQTGAPSYIFWSVSHVFGHSLARDATYSRVTYVGFFKT